MSKLKNKLIALVLICLNAAQIGASAAMPAAPAKNLHESVKAATPTSATKNPQTGAVKYSLKDFKNWPLKRKLAVILGPILGTFVGLPVAFVAAGGICVAVCALDNKVKRANIEAISEEQSIKKLLTWLPSDWTLESEKYKRVLCIKEVEKRILVLTNLKWHAFLCAYHNYCNIFEITKFTSKFVDDSNLQYDELDRIREAVIICYKNYDIDDDGSYAVLMNKADVIKENRKNALDNVTKAMRSSVANDVIKAVREAVHANIFSDLWSERSFSPDCVSSFWASDSYFYHKIIKREKINKKYFENLEKVLNNQTNKLNEMVRKNKATIVSNVFNDYND